MTKWRGIKGFEDLYIISDKGEIVSLPRYISNGKKLCHKDGRTLSQGERGTKYLKYKFVVLCRDGEERCVSVHRLVAETFIDNPDNLPEVNHKDKNTFNNSVDNLEWCDRQYNIEYSKNKRVAQYTIEGEKIAEYKSVKYAASMTGIKPTGITNVLRGWSHTAGGYVWEYAD